MLAARRIAGLRCAALTKAGKIIIDFFQALIDGGFAVRARECAGHQVFFNSQMLETVPAFHDLHHATLDQFVRAQRFNFIPVVDDRAFRHLATFGMQKIGNSLQGRRLTCPIGAQNCHNAALRHLKGNTLQDQNDVVVNHFDVVDGKEVAGALWGAGGILDLFSGRTH